MRGGLGNQLFILAFAYYLTELNNEQAIIELDTREYKTYKVRDFELFKLIDDSKLSILNEDEKHLFYDITREVFHVAQRLYRNETNSIKWLSRLGYYYSRRSPLSVPLTNANTAFVYGYYQNSEIASRVRKRLLEHIPPNTVSIDGYDPSKPSIAISIRWGQDYVDAGWPICRADYFHKGIQKVIDQKYKNQDIQILVFSDEIAKAKEANLHKNAIYVKGLSSAEQMKLMMTCDDYVIANSSFSWWGAFLGREEDSIVVMPKYWYEGNVLTESTELMYENTVIVEE